ncbi:endonuclease/exonuclease/phosphatase family protein [Marisediminicola senii]|uniref:endonuclease/exonuclease/phosphatase family protein n=1 Tax=Marisediminicola senii TaxID=2711233 RepID=UPI0013EE37CC|nr:endonuclease/exonuclease/phosphatase family protein [Marisediminicola senii]
MPRPALIGPVSAPRLHVMTFNVRRPIQHLNPRHPDRWPLRQAPMRAVLEAEQPTILGIQEAVPEQADFVTRSLGPDYRAIGRGRAADGSGERCSIVYDGRRLELTSDHQYALSRTPDAAGSRSFGNLLPRILTIAHFTDRATGLPLLIANTHLDHLSGRSRLRSAVMIRDLVAAAGVPAVVMGDANSPAGSTPYDALGSGGVLRDAWTAAGRRLGDDVGTFSNYRAPKPGGKRIDWIFVSHQLEVESAGVLPTGSHGAAASDHEPVQALIRVRGARDSSMPDS